MSLEYARFNFSVDWKQYKANTGYANTSQGPDSNALGINYTVGSSNADGVLNVSGTLAAAATVTLDLFSFIDAMGQSKAFTRGYCIAVKTASDSLKIEPGAINALTWFFGGTTPSITCPAGAGFAFGQPTAQTIDATHRNIKLSNVGSVTLTYTVAIIGGP